MDIQSHIQELGIVNYRGLSNVQLKDLSRINIFVGSNNSGKTSILEAIKLLSAPHDMGQIIRIALLRVKASNEAKRKNLVNYLLSIFKKERDEELGDVYHINLRALLGGNPVSYEVDATLGEAVDSFGNANSTVAIGSKASDKNGKKTYQSVEIINGTHNVFTPVEKPLFNATYLHASVSYYQSCVSILSYYIVHEGKEDILRILQMFDATIKDISVVGEDIYLHSSVAGSIPLFAYGSGMQKALYLSAALVFCQNSIILIDEIDNAIHVTAFEDVFRWFIKACIQYNVQAFITTHSAEAIDAILRIANNECNGNDCLRIITLRKDNHTGKTRTKMRNSKEAYMDREVFKMEFRV
ncbi:MAG: AAA family ATPase [Paludibacteraceae bacterium]|nr:AAA family ATPase [Paludibacteraceae bacterium]